MRVLSKKFLCSSCSCCHSCSTHVHSPSVSKLEDAQQVSPCQCLVPDAVGENTLNGDAKVEIEHRGIDDGNAEERRLDGWEGQYMKFDDSEAEETRSSNDDRDEDETSDDDSAEKRTLVKAEDEEGATSNGVARNGQLEDAVDEDGSVDSVVESSTSENEDDQVRPRYPIRSSLRKPSNSGSQVPAKKVKWMEDLAEVHEYVNNEPEDIPTCACVIL